MKKVILVVAMFAVMFLVSFTANPPEKTYKFNFTDSQLAMLWDVLAFSKASMQTSQSPAIDVKRNTGYIDTLQKLIQIQFISQSKADSTVKKDK